MVDERFFFISFFFLSLFFEDVGDSRDLDADALIAKQMGSDESRMMDYKWVEGGIRGEVWIPKNFVRALLGFLYVTQQTS